MSICESTITNPKKQLEFYKQLSEQLQREKEQLEKRNKEIYDGFLATAEEVCELQQRIDKTIEYIEENEKEYGSLEDNEKIILKILKGEEQ